MKNQVIHYHMYKPGPFSGSMINTTLCQRVRNQADYNVSDIKSEVTCKFCSKILGQKYE